MRIITKKYKAFNIADLKKDDELCNTIYQKFWLESENNINPWADENLDSFKEFARTLILDIDYSLTNADRCPVNRDCYIKLIPDYDLDNKDYKELLQDYKGVGYYLCENLKTFTLKLLAKKEYKVLCKDTTDDFVEKIGDKMFELWFADNRDYFSKESFLRYVELNDYEFDENNQLI
mgnify:CR=1 FL=1|tara:strand:+ start:762 stop:1292 length:531 start_codon:yes stop_codon:yes gene_type:complete